MSKGLLQSGVSSVALTLTEQPTEVCVNSAQTIVVASTVDFYIGLTSAQADTGAFFNFGGINVPFSTPPGTTRVYIRSVTGEGPCSIFRACGLPGDGFDLLSSSGDELLSSTNEVLQGEYNDVS